MEDYNQRIRLRVAALVEDVRERKFWGPDRLPSHVVMLHSIVYYILWSGPGGLPANSY